MIEPYAAFVVVDASVWVSRLVTRDIFHEFVKEWMETHGSDGMIFLSPALLLPEVAGAIARPTGDSHLARQAIESLQGLTSLRIVEMDQSLVGDAARLAADLGLRGADSLYVALAARLNLSLATLDADQYAKASSVIAVQLLKSIAEDDSSGNTS